MLTWIAPLIVVAVTPGAAHVTGAEPDPVGIYGGGPTEACTWPTTVSLGSCTATLVHPRVIVYAAHCGSGYNSAFLGDDAGGSGRSVPTSFCKTYPGFGNLGNGNDWAFCVLAEEVTDVPITPPLMGCETELLTPGAEVYMVGFGYSNNGGYGRKHVASATLNEITSGNEANIGGNGTGVTICNGDSGGPAFIRLPESEGFDGSWRAFGIASWIYTPCGNEGFHTLMHAGMDWIESESGVDITPCHDADGTWNPGPECKGFATDPTVSQGNWNTCEFAEVSGWSTACGPSYPELTDSLPPTVRVSSHVDGDVEVADGGLAAFNVTVDATDPDSGVRDVQLLVDGAAVGSADNTAPFEFSLSLGEGEHTLGAVAVDEADNSAEADPVTLIVSAHAEPPAGDEGGVGEGDDGDDDDDDDDGADDGDAGGDGAADVDDALPPGFGHYDDVGCGCRGANGGPGWAMLILPWLLARRRREIA